MDFSFVTELYIPIAVVAGLVVGFVLKKWIPTDNKWIPTILPIIIVVINIHFNVTLIIFKLIFIDIASKTIR